MLGLLTLAFIVGRHWPGSRTQQAAVPSAGPKSAFDHVYAAHVWGLAGGGSGPGSSLASTRAISALLVHFVMAYNINTFLDAACGAMEWMPGTLDSIDDIRTVNGLAGRTALPPLNYTGADIVGALIARHRQSFGLRPHWKFVHADMTAPSWPTQVGGAHDVVMARDVFFHMSSDKVIEALRNIQRTGSRWLLATHTPFSVKNNSDLPTSSPRGMGLNQGGVRGLNLNLPPYNLPPPKWEFTELNNHGARAKNSKQLGLWLLDELTILPTVSAPT